MHGTVRQYYVFRHYCVGQSSNNIEITGIIEMEN